MICKETANSSCREERKCPEITNGHTPTLRSSSLSWSVGIQCLRENFSGRSVSTEDRCWEWPPAAGQWTLPTHRLLGMVRIQYELSFHVRPRPPEMWILAPSVANCRLTGEWWTDANAYGNSKAVGECAQEDFSLPGHRSKTAGTVVMMQFGHSINLKRKNF